MADNIVTFGLRNVHYSLATQDDDGRWSFGEPVALPGAQEFTSDLIGSSSSVYADDQVVATLNENAGRTVTLKMTELTDDFKRDILGYRKLANGNMVEITNAPVVTFALGLEFQGDAKARRVWFYLCTCSPISEGTKSRGDSVEANSISLSITARPIEVGSDLYATHATSSKGDANYDTFLTSKPAVPEVTE